MTELHLLLWPYCCLKGDTHTQTIPAYEYLVASSSPRGLWPRINRCLLCLSSSFCARCPRSHDSETETKKGSCGFEGQARPIGLPPPSSHPHSPHIVFFVEIANDGRLRVARRRRQGAGMVGGFIDEE